MSLLAYLPAWKAADKIPTISFAGGEAWIADFHKDITRTPAGLIAVGDIDGIPDKSNIGSALAILLISRGVPYSAEREKP